MPPPPASEEEEARGRTRRRRGSTSTVSASSSSSSSSEEETKTKTPPTPIPLPVPSPPYWPKGQHPTCEIRIPTGTDHPHPPPTVTYTVQQALGKGCFARVYYAEPTSHAHQQTCRPFALKLVHTKTHNQANQFLREWHAYRRLNTMGKALDMYPSSLLRYYEHHTLPGNLAYFVMDLIPSLTLEDYINHEWRRRQRKKEDHGTPIPDELFSPALVFYLMRQLSQAVAFMHEAGAAHLDIKPANISFDPVERQVKLFDLGFACCRPLVEEGPTDQPFRVSTRVGTPLYFAPEQLRCVRDNDDSAACGKAATYDFDPFPADVWQLGHVFYILMTGQHVFEDCCTDMQDLHTTLFFTRPSPLLHPVVKRYPDYQELLSKTLCCYQAPMLRIKAGPLDTLVRFLSARHPLPQGLLLLQSTATTMEA